jgi:hypothetical protein
MHKPRARVSDNYTALRRQCTCARRTKRGHPSGFCVKNNTLESSESREVNEYVLALGYNSQPRTAYVACCEIYGAARSFSFLNIHSRRVVGSFLTKWSAFGLFIERVELKLVTFPHGEPIFYLTFAVSLCLTRDTNLKRL